MRSVLVAGLLIATASMVGCKKEAAVAPGHPGAPPSTTEQDALWALAPEGAKFGFVASPRGLAMLERGAIAIDALLDATPELASLRRTLDDALSREAGVSKPRLADFGLTADKGFAAFGAGDEKGVMVIPVADRDKFLAKVHGTKGADHDVIKGTSCKTIQGRYACARDPAVLAKLGRADLVATLKTAGARGDLEIAGHSFTSSDDPSVAVVAQLDRGSFVLRGAVARVPSQVTDAIGRPNRPREGAAAAGGFGVIDLTPYLAQLPPLPIAPNVTLAGLGKTVAGPVTLTIPAGTMDLDLRIPLSDPGPAKALVEHCTDLPPLASAGATVAAGVCHVPLPQIGLALDAWVDGTELRIGNRAAGKAAELAPSPLAEELAHGEWSMAFFSRGVYVDLTVLPDAPRLLQAIPSEGRMVLRLLPLLNELGVGLRKEGETVRFVLGVRTAWANPDDVVRKLLAISLDDMISGKGGETGKSIAGAAPSSLFAQDLKAGPAGMMGVVAPVGIIASVAIPAFMDYMKRSKKTEAALHLDKIGKNAKVAYLEHGAFPAGTAALTPATSCCGGPSNHCEAPPEAWQQPVWKSLDFHIHEPSLFRYSYESDGKTFTAKAVGDLDCDGVEITYELRGTSDNGQPTVTLTEPAVNAD